MFYENQSITEKENYKKMLYIMGRLSALFSKSDCPYLVYRAHENIFCKFLGAKNLARDDNSADAMKNGVGIGLKTWIGQNDQKVAEFGKLKNKYENLSGLELVKTISEYRNERIRVTMSLNGIKTMIYHIVKRVPGAMQIFECAFDLIDIKNIKLIEDKGNQNNTYFTDGKHEYHFSTSKNTLYMIFEDMTLLDGFDVDILSDPYTFLMNCMKDVAPIVSVQTERKPQICLPLYSLEGEKGRKKKVVKLYSGLNQWNAHGRKRGINELYIPYNKLERECTAGFFPPREVPFKLHLSDGTEMSAKVCQDGGKAIMSNPNKDLGKWLLRDVFNLPERTIVTYEMLEKFGVDSVIFTKNAEKDYSVDFAPLGTYEKFYNLDDESEGE